MRTFSIARISFPHSFAFPQFSPPHTKHLVWAKMLASSNRASEGSYSGLMRRNAPIKWESWGWKSTHLHWLFSSWKISSELLWKYEPCLFVDGELWPAFRHGTVRMCIMTALFLPSILLVSGAEGLLCFREGTITIFNEVRASSPPFYASHPPFLCFPSFAGPSMAYSGFNALALSVLVLSVWALKARSYAETPSSLYRYSASPKRKTAKIVYFVCSVRPIALGRGWEP